MLHVYVIPYITFKITTEWNIRLLPWTLSFLWYSLKHFFDAWFYNRNFRSTLCSSFFFTRSTCILPFDVKGREDREWDIDKKFWNCRMPWNVRWIYIFGLNVVAYFNLKWNYTVYINKIFETWTKLVKNIRVELNIRIFLAAWIFQWLNSI